MNLTYIIGQALSVIAVIIGFISFQMKTDKQVLTFQTASMASQTLSLPPFIMSAAERASSMPRRARAAQSSGG